MIDASSSFDGVLGVAAPSRSYYISSSGNDNALGTLAAPWQTITKVNAATLNPGDSVLFAAGQTFTGAIVCPSAGMPDRPITFGSYGNGRATISASAGHGFLSTNQNGIVVRDLNFTGTASTNHGVHFNNTLAANVHLRGIAVINCSVSGFGQNGIFVQGSAGSAGYDDVLTRGCVAFNCTTISTAGNGSAGILVVSYTGYGRQQRQSRRES